MKKALLKKSIVGLFVALLLGLTGCFGVSTTGEFQKLEFSYTSGTGCLFGCGIDRWMLLNTKETISIRGTVKLPITSIVSSNKDVFRAKLIHNVDCCVQREEIRDGKKGTTTSCSALSLHQSCSGPGQSERHRYRIELEATGTGSAKLQLTKAQGGVYEQFDVTVRSQANTELRLKGGSDPDAERPATHFTLKVGQKRTPLPGLVDSRGLPVQASSFQCTLKSQDPKIISFTTKILLNPIRESDSTSISLQTITLSSVQLNAKGPGQTTVRIQCAGMTPQDFSFHVTK